MNVAFRKSFSHDLRKLQADKRTLVGVRKVIAEVGSYRVGIAVEDGSVEFIRCLHRKDIYRFFP